MAVIDTASGATFKSERKFGLFSYGVSHGPLLLRSGKTEEHGTRLEVLITDVRVMEIRVWFTGIHIQEVELARLANRLSRPAGMFEAGLKAYLLSSSEWEGFVLGGSLHTAEDDGSFFDLSAFQKAYMLPGTSPQITAF